jgi:hypothetical protein
VEVGEVVIVGVSVIVGGIAVGSFVGDVIARWHDVSKKKVIITEIMFDFTGIFHLNHIFHYLTNRFCYPTAGGSPPCAIHHHPKSGW